MKTITKNNKSYWECNVVMLPTENSKAPLVVDDDDKSLHLTYELFRNKGNAVQDITYQHLYITSDEEIKEGDWIINKPSNKPHQVKDISYLYESDKKIIATTDKSLIGVPQIPQSFVEQFVKADGIDKVLVEVELYAEAKVIVDKKVYPIHTETVMESKSKLLINQDNRINIELVEEKVYTRDEVIKSIKLYGTAISKHTGVDNDGEHCYCTLDKDNWIKENL